MYIDDDDVLDLIHWARRYCDGRSTYSPSAFNTIYNKLYKKNKDLFEKNDHHDITLTEKGKFFPYAQDGMYNESTGSYDARPKRYLY